MEQHELTDAAGTLVLGSPEASAATALAVGSPEDFAASLRPVGSREAIQAGVIRTGDIATMELPVVVDLWREADRRGWSVVVDRTTGSWRATAPDRTSGMAYERPGDFGAGAVSVFDLRRTLTLTGLDDAAQAAALMRTFLGWPVSGSAITAEVASVAFCVGGDR